MKSLLRRYLLPFVMTSAVLLPVMFVHSCANTSQAPTGGDKDTIPPVIVGIKPLPGAIRVPVSGASVTFTFNEYVTVKEPKNIFLSPPQQKAPKYKMKGKSLVVYFEDDLEPNTTYTLNLTGALADNNEGNPYPGYTYVFSTGTQIDSMMMTGTVQDCNTLEPFKGATVLLYKDHADSASMLHRPYAAAKTDDWGFFCIPFIQDTLYRIYAIKDDNSNNIYDPDTDLIAFIDSLLRPSLVVNDTIPELLKYDMKDTLACLARRSEHELNLFRERPKKQFLKNKARTGDRSAYISFNAPDVWIDSIWVRGIAANRLITQFNIQQDSLEIWLNDRKEAPDTIHLFVNYRKTDSLGVLKPELEHLRLAYENGRKTIAKSSRKNIKHEDTTCVFTLKAEPENVEQNGFRLEFSNPIIFEKFDSVKFSWLNPKQKEFKGSFEVEKDTLNLRCYTLRPKVKLQTGYEYFMKVPPRAFRDINGFWSDSLDVKVSLPTDETLSTMTVNLTGVDRKFIVDLMDEKGSKSVRTYVIESDTTLQFPYLKAATYCLRFTDDGNKNGIVDTGSLLDHRQPEKVRFYKRDGKRFIEIPQSSEVEQDINLQEVFKD